MFFYLGHLGLSKQGLFLMPSITFTNFILTSFRGPVRGFAKWLTNTLMYLYNLSIFSFKLIKTVVRCVTPVHMYVSVAMEKCKLLTTFMVVKRDVFMTSNITV